MVALRAEGWMDGAAAVKEEVAPAAAEMDMEETEMVVRTENKVAKQELQLRREQQAE